VVAAHRLACRSGFIKNDRKIVFLVMDAAADMLVLSIKSNRKRLINFFNKLFVIFCFFSNNLTESRKGKEGKKN